MLLWPGLGHSRCGTSLAWSDSQHQAFESQQVKAGQDIQTMLIHGEDTPQGTLCALPICLWNPLVVEASMLSQP